MTKKYPTPTKSSSALGTAVGAAFFGAIVGGTAAAAKGIRKVKAGEAEREEVVIDVAREAGSTAVAAGAATAFAGALGLGPILSTLGIVAVATGTKYAMDSLLTPQAPATAPVMVSAGKAAAATPVATPKKAAKKPAAKKTAAQKTATKKSTAKKAAPKKTATKKATTKKTTARKAAPKAAPKTETTTDKA